MENAAGCQPGLAAPSTADEASFNINKVYVRCVATRDSISQMDNFLLPFDIKGARVQVRTGRKLTAKMD